MIVMIILVHIYIYIYIYTYTCIKHTSRSSPPRGLPDVDERRALGPVFTITNYSVNYYYITNCVIHYYYTTNYIIIVIRLL